MIKKTVRDNIFKTNARHIAFAINTEGFNDSGFAGQVSERWSELENCGKNNLGTVISKEINGKVYHALVCHSLNDGWGDNQDEIIKECFDKISANGEEIATVAIGTGFIGMLSGANFGQIVCGMHDSNQKIILYGGYSLEEIINIYDKAKIEKFERRFVK